MRAPVLTLWAAVVAERLGFDEDEALSLGKALAGLNAQTKGRRLGIFKPHEEGPEKARKKERGEDRAYGAAHPGQKHRERHQSSA